jgi:thiol:disulfide interchange protein
MGASMPSNVRNFLGLSILALAISIVGSVIGFDEAVAMMPIPNAGTILMISSVGMFAISFGLIAAAGWGRQNWARWVILIFFLLGLASLAISFQKLLVMSSFHIGTALITTLLKGVALYFVFTGNAKEWFEPKRV